jgi:hypothetical protein
MKIIFVFIASILLASFLSYGVLAEEIAYRDPVALTIWEKIFNSLEKMNKNLISIFTVLDEESKKECEWESLNQGSWNFEEYIGHTSGFSEYRDWEQLFQIPENIPYDEIYVVSGRVKANCVNDNSDCEVVVNGISCFNVTHGDSEQNIYELPDSCLNSFVAGSNSIIYRLPPDSNARIFGMLLETKVKPANC